MFARANLSFSGQGADRQRMTASRSDRLAAILGAVFFVLAIGVGLHVGNHQRDVDEVVYQRTLASMTHGQGYYPSMRSALTQKEHAPPSEIRSIRPPTLFLALYRIPAAAQRWAVGLVFLAALGLAWRIGRPLASYGGPIAVALTGAWLVGASPMLYLHSELWGLPLLLGGVLAMRDERWGTAALCLAAAALLRETYAIAFLAGLVWTKDRRWWWPTMVGLAVFAGVHAQLASSVLARRGLETPFGASGLGLRYVLTAIGPGDQPLAWALGIAGGALGLWGLTAQWRHDRGARTLLTFAVAMYPATILVGRTYWGLAFGAAVAGFAPAGAMRAGAVWRRYAPGHGAVRRRPFRAASS